MPESSLMINLRKRGSEAGGHRLRRSDPLRVAKLLMGTEYENPVAEAKNPRDTVMACGVPSAPLTPVPTEQSRVAAITAAARLLPFRRVVAV